MPETTQRPTISRAEYNRRVAARRKRQQRKVFYDNRTDFTGFDHSLHFLKSGTIEGRTRNAVIRKEAIVPYSFLFAVIFEDLFLR